MKRYIVAVAVAVLLAGTSGVLADLLPGGDFSEPNFADGLPRQTFDGVGRWFYAIGGAPPVDTATVEGSGDARHVKLHTGWEGRSVYVCFSNDTPVALTEDFSVSSDVWVAGIGDYWFGLGTGLGSTYVERGSNVMQLEIEKRSAGCTVNWTLAGGASGSKTLTGGLTDASQKLTYSFDAANGTLSTSLGGEVIFEDQAVDTGAAVSQILFGRSTPASTYNWYAGDLHVDNVSIVPEPATLSLIGVCSAFLVRYRR